MTRLRALFSKREFSLESVDLNEATQEVLALSLSDLQRHRVILQSELADDLPTVTGDRIQLQQVILNLVRNASEAMVEVHKRPRLLLIKTAREDVNRVRLTVRDSGIGLPPECLDSLFDAFHTTKSGGMGIGLFVSRSIVERHQGRLWAEPNDGGPGATFSFSIPFQTGPDARAGFVEQDDESGQYQSLMDRRRQSGASCILGGKGARCLVWYRSSTTTSLSASRYQTCCGSWALPSRRSHRRKPSSPRTLSAKRVA